jgi:ABC-type Zn uptake system ZnuABC Zn-binding protein ZnuA
VIAKQIGLSYVYLVGENKLNHHIWVDISHLMQAVEWLAA